MKSKLNGWLAAVLAGCLLMFASTGTADTGQVFAKAPLLEHMPALATDLDTVLGADAMASTSHDKMEGAAPTFETPAVSVMNVSVTEIDAEPRGPDQYPDQFYIRVAMAIPHAQSTMSPGRSTSRISG